MAQPGLTGDTPLRLRRNGNEQDRSQDHRLTAAGPERPALVDKIITTTAAEGRIDALLEFSAQHAIPIERTELAAGCTALIGSSMPLLSDEDIQGINGGLIGWNTALEMAYMVHRKQAFDAQVKKMQSQGYSEAYINEYIFARNNPGAKMVVIPRPVD